VSADEKLIRNSSAEFLIFKTHLVGQGGSCELNLLCYSVFTM